MSAELYAVVAVSAIAITALLVLIFMLRREHERILFSVIAKAAEKEMEWAAERKQLLDRIQAPSFAEYKSAEIKLEKVKNGEKEPPRLEPL